VKRYSRIRLFTPAGNETRTPPSLRITPPAPVFDEKEKLAELAQRRSRVAQKIGSKGIMILFSSEPRVYANDVDTNTGRRITSII